MCDLESGQYNIIESLLAGESSDAVLYHGLNNCTNKAICGLQSGNLNLMDIEEGQSIHTGTNMHANEVWYCSYSSHGEGNIVYSAADDASFKKWDTRVGFD